MAAWMIGLVVLILVGLFVGTALNFAAPFLAIPIVLLALVAWYFYAVVRRAREQTSMRSERDAAATGGTEFTERDRETLTESR
jgi:membrane protein implicated in regulation of membrane protease activity